MGDCERWSFFGAVKANILSIRCVSELEMINNHDKYSHPYYWLSFIPSGSWTPMELR